MTLLPLQPRVDDLVTASPPDANTFLPSVDALMGSLLAGLGDGLAVRMCREHLGTGGKRLRARLALEATAALGGILHEAVPWAAACELIHNASLVHDDLQDGDRVRRGSTALWATYGVGQAINAGDLLLMLPTLALGELDGSGGRRWTLAQLVARHGALTAIGQAAEMGLRDEVHVGIDAYLDAARGKTAGLFGMPVEGAALLAAYAPADAAALGAPFETLGLVYQLTDDVVDLYGDKGRDRPGADIREGKVSALVACHLARHPEDALWLGGILRSARDDTTDDQVHAVIDRFREGGALRDVLDRIDGLVATIDAGALADEPRLAQVAHGLRDRILRPLEPLRA